MLSCCSNLHRYACGRDRPMLLSAALFVMAACVVVNGCGDSNRAAVSGTVTLDGAPLEQGVINFFPAEGNKGPTAGGTITSGRYEIASEKGVAVGSNRVTISSVQKTGRKIQGVDVVHEERLEAVPAKYNSETTLVHDVQPGKNVLDFDLQDRVPIESIRRRYPGNR
jgi:hypothetical protein